MNCVLCGGPRSDDFIAGLKKCAGCGLVFAGIDVRADDTKDIYKNDYFFGKCYVDYVREKKALQLNFRNRLRELLRYVDNPKARSVFEIGSAYGFFLDLARDKFESVSGIDITQEGCDYAKKKMGLDVACGDFLEYGLEKGKYDIFCLWDTIEHLTAPHLYIEKIGDCIRENGLISLTTGDIESLTAKISGDKWRIIHPPEHLFYFSRRTATALLNKYGFEVLAVNYGGNYRNLDCLFLNAQDSPLYRRLKDSPVAGIPFYLNLYDIMHVIAKKRPNTRGAAK